MKGALARFCGNRAAAAALAILALLVLAAALAPWISPQNPYDLAQLDVLDGKLPPGAHSAAGKIYVLGTDDQGRDMLSGIFYGLRTSLVAAGASTAFALAVGLALGLTAAWLGGWFEALVMRAVDLQLSFPSILIALVLLAVLGQGLDKIVVALVLVQWAYYARTVRAVAIAEKQKDYVQAAVAFGVPAPRILARHLLPNCLPPLVVVAALQIAAAITLEATLSFLGLGLPITEPSLGLLIANGYTYLLSGSYWMSVFPGIVLALAIVCVNVVADRLRDIGAPGFRH